MKLLKLSNNICTRKSQQQILIDIISLVDDYNILPKGSVPHLGKVYTKASVRTVMSRSVKYGLFTKINKYEYMLNPNVKVRNRNLYQSLLTLWRDSLALENPKNDAHPLPTHDILSRDIHSLIRTISDRAGYGHSLVYHLLTISDNTNRIIINDFSDIFSEVNITPRKGYRVIQEMEDIGLIHRQSLKIYIINPSLFISGKNEIPVNQLINDWDSMA